MKKSILAVAGVAAFAGVAMPVAGAFADGISDSISVTVGSNCSFTRSNSTGTYNVTMNVDDLKENVGSSTYKVVCNNPSGYTVSATFEGLAGKNLTENDTIDYSAETPSAGSQTWTATVGNSNIAALTGFLMSSSEATTAEGKTATVTYKVSTGEAQKQGTYTGTATYTFAEKTGAQS
jgi:hypothetical protein